MWNICKLTYNKIIWFEEKYNNYKQRRIKIIFIKNDVPTVFYL